jgi:hypothetical protein
MAVLCSSQSAGHLIGSSCSPQSSQVGNLETMGNILFLVQHFKLDAKAGLVALVLIYEQNMCWGWSHSGQTNLPWQHL